jgi:hypothetical protein
MLKLVMPTIMLLLSNVGFNSVEREMMYFSRLLHSVKLIRLMLVAGGMLPLYNYWTSCVLIAVTLTGCGIYV